MNQEIKLIGIQNNVDIEAGAIEKFISAIVPACIRDAGGVLSDHVRAWRYRNQIRILEKTKKYCEEHSISPKEVPLKFLVPLIEHAALEEDESMQNRWAALLANATANNKDINPSFIEILKQLNSREALVLDILYNEVSKTRTSDYDAKQTLQFTKEKIWGHFSMNEKTIDIILDNLFRLGLCRPPGSHAKLGKYPFALQTKEFFEFTPLGFAFVDACKL